MLDQADPIAVTDAAEAGDRWENFSRIARAARRRLHTLDPPPRRQRRDGGVANLYSRRHLELGHDRIEAAIPFAEQLAVAIHGVEANRATAKLARDLAEAIRSRAVIEQAKGIIMADNRIDADAAFEQLVQLSQQANLKLRDVAYRFVDERTKAPD